jgi:hypothetical protein
MEIKVKRQAAGLFDYAIVRSRISDGRQGRVSGVADLKRTKPVRQMR